MARFLLRRVGLALITLFLLSIIVFLMANVLPGDVGRRILGPFADPRAVKALNHQLGVDRPLYIQYLLTHTSREWRERSKKPGAKAGQYLGRHMVPVVLGPNGRQRIAHPAWRCVLASGLRILALSVGKTSVSRRAQAGLSLLPPTAKTGSYFRVPIHREVTSHVWLSD